MYFSFKKEEKKNVLPATKYTYLLCITAAKATRIIVTTTNVDTIAMNAVAENQKDILNKTE